jgi:hypothetical protein
MMDISEFEKLFKPSSKRSSLEPFRSQIFELKNKGYADRQIRDWLAANGLEVTRQTVQIFIKKSKGAPTPNSNKISSPSSPAPTEDSVEVQKRKINTPTELRKSRKIDFDLDDYNQKE